MEETAFAKINLSLRVLGMTEDGYHEIDTLFAFAEHGDRLRVEEGDGLSLAVEGPFAAALAGQGDNLVLRAARLLAEQGGTHAGAALTLEKNLPVASGIGGGSADAAAALRLLDRFWELRAGENDLPALAGRLGSDVPACLLSRTCRGTGRGDVLTPVDEGPSGAPVLLVNPGVPVSTADVFRLWDGTSHEVNDLEPPARRLAPEIGEVLEALAGAPRRGMSGSGATCFALFGDEASRDALAARLPERWWRLASRLR